MHVMLLRAALALYSVGLLHSVLTIIQRKPVLFRAGIASVSAGLVVHVASIVFRAAELQYVPLTHRYDSFSLFAALGALSYLIVFFVYRIAPLSVFVFPLIFISAFIANLFYDPSRFIPPELQSNWLYVHVPLTFLGYAALFISFAAAVMYLIQERELKSKQLGGFSPRLPSLEVCDDLAYRSLAIGFPLITLGIVSGALWAQSVWGSMWGRDLKIVLSFVTWFIYLALIYYRLIAGWRGRRAASSPSRRDNSRARSRRCPNSR